MIFDLLTLQIVIRSSLLPKSILTQMRICSVWLSSGWEEVMICYIFDLLSFFSQHHAWLCRQNIIIRLLSVMIFVCTHSVFNGLVLIQLAENSRFNSIAYPNKNWFTIFSQIKQLDSLMENSFAVTSILSTTVWWCCCCVKRSSKTSTVFPDVRIEFVSLVNLFRSKLIQAVYCVMQICLSYAQLT